MERTQTVTILFCDLVSSTERRARLGDDAFDEFTQRFMTTLRDAIARHHGREVKNAGDGMMVVYPDSTVDAVACAIDMHRVVAELDSDDPPRLRIGISSGEVARDGDDFSGMPIVEAARLEASAAPGQTLANAIVRSLVGTRRALRFRDVGSLSLKGIPVPLATVEVIDDEIVDAGVVDVARPTRSKTLRRPPVAAVVVLLVVVALVVGVLALRPSPEAPRDAQPKPRAAQGVTAPKGYTPRYESLPTCPDDVREVATDATCGRLVVPENRSAPENGKRVTLLVTRAPARLAGPAGAPTIDVCGCENLGNSLARDHSELIHIGQRGFGEGSPLLSCPEFVAVRTQALTKRSDNPTEIARGTAALRRCHADLVAKGIDPAQYNYVAAAQDVLDLMWVLKIRQANFIAFELAGAEVFEVLRRAPGAVRSLTLENAPPPGDTLLTDPIGDLSGAFGRFVALCATDRTCALDYPDLSATLRSSRSMSEARPVVATVENPFSSTPPVQRVLLDGPRTTDALVLALASGDISTYKLIPVAIEQTESEAIVASLALQVDRLDPDAPWGAQASYLCSYDVHTGDPQGYAFAAKSLPEFVRSQNSNWEQWCSGWSVPDVSGALSTDVVSDVPTLMFRGDLSPAGSPEWISKILRGMSNAQAVVFPTLGNHLLAEGPPCLSALRRQFLAHPAATLDTASCARQSPRIPFVAK